MGFFLAKTLAKPSKNNERNPSKKAINRKTKLGYEKVRRAWGRDGQAPSQ